MTQVNAESRAKATVRRTVLDAFAKGDILAVIFVSVLFGCVLARMGDKDQALRDLVDAGTKWVFGVINLMMGELDEARMHAVLDGEVQFVDYRAVTEGASAPR